MKRIDRLIQAREQQRDDAAEELNQARQRLDQLTAEQLRLIRESRAQVCDGTAVTCAELEMMDTARQRIHHAADAGQTAVNDATQEARECHCRLRQLEILRERADERRHTESKRRDRRELDEIAARIKRVTLLLVLMLAPLAACDRSDDRKEPAKAAAPDAGASDAQPVVKKCPDEVFTPDELKLLRKLRDRRVEIQNKRSSLAAEQLQVKAAHGRVSDLLAQVKSLQEKLGQKGAAAVKTPPKPRDPSVDLVQVIKQMNRRAAAAMLAEMDPATVAGALRRLPAPEVSLLMAKMPSEQAALVGAQLAARKKPAAMAPAAAPGGDEGALSAKPPAAPGSDEPKAGPPADAPEKKKRTAPPRRRAARKAPAKPAPAVKAPAKAPAPTKAPAKAAAVKAPANPAAVKAPAKPAPAVKAPAKAAAAVKTPAKPAPAAKKTGAEPAARNAAAPAAKTGKPADSAARSRSK